MKSSLPAFPSRLQVSDTKLLKRAPKRADPVLLTTEHKAWRAEVLRRAGYQCQWLDRGCRCQKRAPDHRLFADHVVERADGGAAFDPANGQALCGEHHTLKTAGARGGRRSKG